MLSRHQLEVHPIVGLISHDFVPQPSEDEVESCFVVPVSWFLEKNISARENKALFKPASPPRTIKEKVISWYKGHKDLHWDIKVFDKNVVEGSTLTTAYRLHYFEYAVNEKTAYGQLDKYLIWGLTAHMLVMLAKVLFKRDPAFDEGPIEARKHHTNKRKASSPGRRK
eukprot:Nk52_evm14s298 gene=Nk52_evmTU14s298